MQRTDHVPGAGRSSGPGEPRGTGSFDLGTGYDRGSTGPEAAREVDETAATGPAAGTQPPPVPAPREADDTAVGTASVPGTTPPGTTAIPGTGESGPDDGRGDQARADETPDDKAHAHEAHTDETRTGSARADETRADDTRDNETGSDDAAARAAGAGPAGAGSARADEARAEEIRAGKVQADGARADSAHADEAQAGETRAAESRADEARAERERAGVHRAPGSEENRLFTSAQSADFRSRWREVQAGFVDDPAAAVTAAEMLLREVTAALTSAVGDRSATSSSTDTEELRTRLRSYRAVVERLLDV